MNRKLVVDEDAAEEAEAQVRYYSERAGMHVALQFVAEIEAIYRGLSEGRLVGVNYARRPRSLINLPSRVISIACSGSWA